ncbi:GIY-YIG nuclease family protein [Marisediminicola sp. LYQ85]|uniref:GIY-YIG nuclease family protein n=1 Tax=Marisediminicola sp. LYQ85 TaxID=3391062 RepID=UPI0039833339
MGARTCEVVRRDGTVCAAPVDDAAPFAACIRHLLDAHDWVVGELGVTDLLPSPCLACGSRLGVQFRSGWMCAICEWRYGETPDGAASDGHAASARVDVVYYVRFGDRIKIGTSGNPRVRFQALPYDEVLAFELGDRMLEQRRHAQFASWRIPRTEWFERSDELDAHVAALAAGVSDPWALYARWRSERLALRG